MVTDTNALTYTDNCGRKCKGNSIRLCLYFLVSINSDISVKGGAADWTWHIAEAFYAFEHVSLRQGKYITYKVLLF